MKSLIHNGEGRSLSTTNHFHVLAQMSMSSAFILVWLVVVQVLKGDHLLQSFNVNGVVVDSILSGFFHVSYTMISVTVMLTVLSVVAHATANLGKRVIISLLFYLIGWQPPTLLNLFCGLVFLAGLMIYTNSKKLKLSETQESQSLILSMIFGVFVLSCAFFPSQNLIASPAGQLPSQDVRPSPLPQAILDPSRTFRARKDYFVTKENKIDFLKVDKTNIDFLYPKYFYLYFFSFAFVTLIYRQFQLQNNFKR